MARWKQRFIAGALLLASSTVAYATADNKAAATATTMREHLRDLQIEGTIMAHFLFNSDKIVEVDEKNYPELDSMLTKLSQKANIAKPLTFVITNKVPMFFMKANAFTCGDKNRAVIFVGSVVLDRMSTEEIEGILAHEMMHDKHSHTLKIWGYGVLFYCGSSIVSSYIIHNVLKQHGLLAILGDWASTTLMTSALSAYYSRRCEKEADLGAVDLTGNAKLADALTKLDDMQKKYLPFSHWLSSILPHPFASHPQTAERIKYIQAAAAKVQ